MFAADGLLRGKGELPAVDEAEWGDRRARSCNRPEADHHGDSELPAQQDTSNDEGRNGGGQSEPVLT